MGSLWQSTEDLFEWLQTRAAEEGKVLKGAFSWKAADFTVVKNIDGTFSCVSQHAWTHAQEQRQGKPSKFPYQRLKRKNENEYEVEPYSGTIALKNTKLLKGLSGQPVGGSLVFVPQNDGEALEEAFLKGSCDDAVGFAEANSEECDDAGALSQTSEVAASEECDDAVGFAEANSEGGISCDDAGGFADTSEVAASEGGDDAKALADTYGVAASEGGDKIHSCGDAASEEGDDAVGFAEANSEGCVSCDDAGALSQTSEVAASEGGNDAGAFAVAGLAGEMWRRNNEEVSCDDEVGFADASEDASCEAGIDPIGVEPSTVTSHSIVLGDEEGESTETCNGDEEAVRTSEEFINECKRKGFKKHKFRMNPFEGPRLGVETIYGFDLATLERLCTSIFKREDKVPLMTVSAKRFALMVYYGHLDEDYDIVQSLAEDEAFGHKCLDKVKRMKVDDLKKVCQSLGYTIVGKKKKALAEIITSTVMENLNAKREILAEMLKM